MGKYIPQLAPLTVLLGEKSPLPPHVSFYQRDPADEYEPVLKNLFIGYRR